MSASLVSETSETGAREDGEEKQEDGERVKAAMSGYLPWEKDLEMLSLFQDKKELLTKSFQEYVTQNPELWALLADYLQALFIQKPDDIFQFARDFFQPYHPQAPDRPSHPTTRQQHHQ